VLNLEMVDEIEALQEQISPVSCVANVLLMCSHVLRD